MNDTRFDSYMNEIDNLLRARIGLGYLDLADYNFRDSFEDQIPASEVVDEMLELEGIEGLGE